MNHMKPFIFRSGIAMLAVLLVSLNTARTQEAPAPVQSAEPNSFREVTQQLDAGGDLYFYIATEKVMAEVDKFIEKLVPTVQQALEARVDHAQGREYGSALVNVLHNAHREFGVSEISGFGVSSIALEPGFYRNKFFIHHRPGRDTGKMWQLCGKAPHELDSLNFLPNNTALASFIDLDMPMAWSWLGELIAGSENPTLIASFNMALQFVNGVIDLNKLMASSGGEMGFILTLNEQRIVNFPIGQQLVQFPEPAIVLVMKATDDFLMQFLEQRLKQRQLPMIKQAMGEVEATVLNFPLPLPFELKPCFAKVGDYLLISTSATVLQEVIEAKTGIQPGLAANETFKQHARELANMKGNGFGYMSPAFGKLMMTIQNNMTNNEDPILKELFAEAHKLQKLENAFSFGVFQSRPDGLMMVHHASTSGAEALITQLTVVPATFLAGALLPTIDRAQTAAQRVNSAGNMKQIGLACLMYSGENNGNFPTPDGEEGLTRLIEERILNIGKVYLHPSDTERTFDAAAEVLTNANCSYLYIGAGFRDDDNEASTTPLLIEKPGISNDHMSILFVDGHVEGFDGEFNSAVEVIEYLNNRFKYSPPRYQVLMNKARAMDKK